MGRDYDGYDCWGLVCLWYRDMLGIELDSFAGISTARTRDIAALIMRQKQTWSTVEKPRRHDVVLMRVRTIETSRLVAHVGVMTDERRMLHVEAQHKSHVVRIDSPIVASRIMEYRRHALVH